MYCSEPFIGMAQSLACLCGAVLVGWMEYNLLSHHKMPQQGALFFMCNIFRGLAGSFVPQASWHQLQLIIFGSMYLINGYCSDANNPIVSHVLNSQMLALVGLTCASYMNHPAIGYALPTLICAFRAHKMMGDSHEALYDSWDILQLGKPKVEQRVVQPQTQPEAQAKPTNAQKADTQEDQSEEVMAATADTERVEVDETEVPAEPTMPRKQSFEQKMIERMRKLQGGKGKVAKAIDMQEMDNQRAHTAPTGKDWNVPKSGRFNAAEDQEKATLDRNNKDLDNSEKARAASEEALNNKMDEAINHLTPTPAPLPGVPEGGPTLQRASVTGAAMTTQFNWNRVGGTTLKRNKSATMSGTISQGQRLKMMKQMQAQNKKLTSISREKGCPGTAIPDLSETVKAADHRDLTVDDCTKAIAGVFDNCNPALTRALGTPDEHALQDPETAKNSDGIIRIRASVLYDQMHRMLEAPQSQIAALKSEVGCCKTVIQRLKAQIRDLKRQNGIQRTINFMERHSYAHEQALFTDPQHESATPADTLKGSWTIMHYGGDISMELIQEDDGMISGDSGEFMENVSGRYDADTRGFCIRIDIGPHVFQLVQGEMVDDFGIVMLRNFGNGVELPTEFCIMMKRSSQTPPPASEEELDSEDGSWYNDRELADSPLVARMEAEYLEEELEQLELLQQGAEGIGESLPGESSNLVAEPEGEPAEPQIATT